MQKMIEKISLIVFSAYDKKYVKYDSNQLIIDFSEYINFIYQKEELDFQYVSLKMIQAFKKYNDDLKENVSDMISEKEVWKSIYKFCHINLTVLDNLSLVFKSIFNLLIYKNKD